MKSLLTLVLFLALTSVNLAASSFNFSLVWSLNDSNVDGRDVAWADYDGDGRPDLALANNGTSASNPGLRVFHNDGGDNFSQAWVSPYNESLSGLAWGDYDKDGRPDILTAPYSGTPRIFHNNGNGTFTSVFSAPSSYYGATAWADVDGDGDLDFALGDISYGGARVYENTGSGFVLRVSLPTAGNQTSIRFGDFNGDGRPDLLVGVTGFGSQIRRNDTSFFFSSVATLPWSNVEDAQWIDLDGDGDLDVVVATMGSQPTAGPATVYRNDGSGVFTQIWKSPEASGYYAYGVAVGDFDGDGLPDLALASAISNSELRTYRNLGGMNFALDWVYADASGPMRPAAGDFDGDGDLDLAVTNTYGGMGSGLRMFRNDRIYWSPTISPTFSNSPTVSPTFTVSPSHTVSPTPTPSSTFSITKTRTASPSFTATPSLTMSATRTLTATRTITLTRTVTATFSDSPTISPTSTITSTRTVSPTPTISETATVTVTPDPLDCGSFSTGYPSGQFHAVASDGNGGAMAVGWRWFSMPAANVVFAHVDASAQPLTVVSQNLGYPTSDMDADDVVQMGGDFFISGVVFGTGAYVGRYNSQGQQIWRLANTWCASCPNSYVTGQGNLLVRNGVTYTTPSARSLNLSAVDLAGNELWTRSYSLELGGTFVADANSYFSRVAFDPCGRLWAAARANLPGAGQEIALVRYSASGDLEFSTSFSNGEENSVCNLAIDAGGNVHVLISSSTTGSHVLRFDPSGALTQDLPLMGVGYFEALSADAEGGILVGGTCAGATCVARYTAAGVQDWKWTRVGPAIVEGVVLDSTGAVFAATHEQDIFKLCPPLLNGTPLSQTCPALTPTPSWTPSPVVTATPTVTVTASFSASPTGTPSFTATLTSTLTPPSSCGFSLYDTAKQESYYAVALDGAGGAVLGGNVDSAGFDATLRAHVDSSAQIINTWVGDSTLGQFNAIYAIGKSGAGYFMGGVGTDDSNPAAGEGPKMSFYDEAGNLLWSRVWGSGIINSVYGMAVGHGMGVTAGYSMDFVSGVQSARLLAYDESGALLWTRSYVPPSSNVAVARAAQFDACERLWVLVRCVDAGVNVTRLLRYTSAGSLEFQQDCPVPNGTGVAMAVDPSGQIHTLVTNGALAPHLVRYTAEGIPAMDIVLSGITDGMRIAADREGGSVVVGRCGLYPCAQRYDSLGALDWQWDGTTAGYAGNVAVEAAGAVFIVGAQLGATTGAFVQKLCPPTLGDPGWTQTCSNQTPTPSITLTVSPSSTLSSTFSPTETPTESPSASFTPTLTLTETESLTASATLTETGSPSATNSPSASRTPTSTSTITFASTIVSSTYSSTPSVTDTSTMTFTQSPTLSPSATATPTLSVSASSTLTPNPTLTPSMTGTSTSTMTPILTRTSTSSITVSPSPTRTASVTATRSPTSTITLSPSQTPSRTASPSVTSTPTLSATVTISLTATPSQTPGPSPTLTRTPIPALIAPLRLIGLYPNPFQGAQTLGLELRQRCVVRLQAYNVAGELVSEQDQLFDPGRYEWQWKGENPGGSRLASGIYILNLTTVADGQIHTVWGQSVIQR